jgi:hypothetical protein
MPAKFNKIFRNQVATIRRNRLNFCVDIRPSSAATITINSYFTNSLWKQSSINNISLSFDFPRLMPAKFNNIFRNQFATIRRNRLHFRAAFLSTRPSSIAINSYFINSWWKQSSIWNLSWSPDFLHLMPAKFSDICRNQVSKESSAFLINFLNRYM